MLRAYLICRNLLLAIALLVTGMVLIASPASAHHPVISGTAVCNPTTGKYDVTWTIRSDADYNKYWLLTRVSRTIGITTPTAAQDDQTAFIGRETVDPGARTLNLEVEARWHNRSDSTRDIATASRTGNVTIPTTRCDPDAADAAASVSTTPATCQAGETLVYGPTTYANLSGTPNGTVGPNPYSVTATADAGHTFSSGNKTVKFDGTLAGPLDADDNACAAKDASAAISTTPPACGVGETLVLGAVQHATWGAPSLSAGPGNYVVVATADPGYRFADGTKTKEFRGTLAGPLPDNNGPNFPGCDRSDQPDPTKRQEPGERSACDLRDVGGTEFWTDEWTTTYVWRDQLGWTGQETGPVRIDESFVPFTDDEYLAECAPVQPADLVREVPGGDESCELQGAMTWVDVYTTPAVWNPETRAWELGQETGPVRTDEEYVAWSDERFEDECAEEPEVRGEEAEVLEDEVSPPEVKGEQAVVPSAVDAGLASNQNPLDVRRNPLWLVVGMFLGLLGTVGARRRRAANR